jgi:hypothetical protein
METLIHADIFFFVSTVGLIVISVGIAVALFYAIRILRDVSHVSTIVKEESDEIAKDVQTLRGNIKSEGLRMKHISGFFGHIFKRRKGR